MGGFPNYGHSYDFPVDNMNNNIPGGNYAVYYQGSSTSHISPLYNDNGISAGEIPCYSIQILWPDKYCDTVCYLQ